MADPNLKRRELYAKKFGKTDPELKNYKEYSEDMVNQFPLEAEQQPLLQSALMLRENRTGYVRVVVGGSGATESKYNRATQARRQAGSSFKPVIYAAALNKGFTCCGYYYRFASCAEHSGNGRSVAAQELQGRLSGARDI